MLKSTVRLAVPALAALLACSASDDAPKQPLGVSASEAVGTPANGVAALPLAAKQALDAGNTAYRAKNFELAITKYREAAIAAPAHAAPWFGVYMAANELKNTALADSAMVRVKDLSADPQLPPGHPNTQPLPPGHPSPVKKP